jgi:hypothetical protein
MSETRKLAAIVVPDSVGYTRLASAVEDRILARLRTLRSDLIDPTVAVHHGLFVKRTGDGAPSSNSAASSTPCAARSKSRTGWPNVTLACRRIAASSSESASTSATFVEEADGDLMGDGRHARTHDRRRRLDSNRAREPLREWFGRFRRPRDARAAGCLQFLRSQRSFVAGRCLIWRASYVLKRMALASALRAKRPLSHHFGWQRELEVVERNRQRIILILYVESDDLIEQ